MSILMKDVIIKIREIQVSLSCCTHLHVLLKVVLGSPVQINLRLGGGREKVTQTEGP